MTKSTSILVGILVGLMGLAGCTAGGGTGPGDVTPGGAVDGKGDAWDWQSDPSRFRTDLEYRISELPLQGRAQNEAWPSTYWPTYEDSIQHRWRRGELSPAEKFDQAFNGWTPAEGFMDLRPFSRSNWTEWDESYYSSLGPLASHVSRNMGNRRDRDQARAAIAAAPEGEQPTRPDEWEVETWWGLCHAWVPASMLEERPLRSVEYNGVTFHVGDMEALLIAAYNRSAADMIGGRCNRGGSDEDYQVERDENGRAINPECRDTNPGSFHVIMTNFLGRLNIPYAEDRTYDYQVWNQPVVEYEVTKMEEIDVARANELLGLTGDTYIYNDDAVKLYEVNANTTYITESHASTTPADASSHERRDYYTYILEVDADGKVIGGEWTGRTRSNHPDFLWNPRARTSSSVPHLDLDKVRMLVQMSRTPPGGGGTTPSGAVSVTGPGNVSIPDNDPNGVTVTANVAESINVGRVELELDIAHTYIGDLKIALRHNGVERTVHNREGGGTDNITNLLDVTGFEGTTSSGTWELFVSDNANVDTGTINSWRLIIHPADGSEPPPEPGDGVQTFTGTGAGAAIPDNDPSGITGSATIPAGTTGAMTVKLDITHTYRGDLKVTLSNGSQSFTLHDRAGGGRDDLSGDFPVEAVGDLGGTWTLSVSDHANVDTGTLNSWSIEVRTN